MVKVNVSNQKACLIKKILKAYKKEKKKGPYMKYFLFFTNKFIDLFIYINRPLYLFFPGIL